MKHNSREDYRVFHVRRYALLLELLERHVDRKLDRCLDVGGGGDIGGLGAVIRERFAKELHALDQGDDVARAAAQGIQAIMCDIDREPFPYGDGFFDLVIFASVIEHLYHPRHVLDEIARVLRPGGLLLLEAPNAVAFGRRLDALAGRNPFRVFNEYNAGEGGAFMVNCAVFYTAEEVEAALGPGYEILERRFAMHTPPAVFVKRWARELVFRIAPRAGDCFAVVARRK